MLLFILRSMGPAGKLYRSEFCHFKMTHLDKANIERF